MKSNQFLTEGIVEDAHEMHQDHEVQMAREECYHAAGDAIALHKLLKHVSEQNGIEGWVAAKITLAADYMKTVREYLEYELMSGHSQENGAVQQVLPVAEGVITAEDFKTITEVDPHRFDSDEDYYNAVRAQGRKKYSADWDEEDERASREAAARYDAKQRMLAVKKAKAEKAADHDSVNETSAGSIAGVVNPTPKNKAKVGTLFGGTYTPKKAK